MATLSAHADGVRVQHVISRSRFDNQAVRVSFDPAQKKYQFSLCETVTSQNCQILGRQEGYSEEQLISLRRNLRLTAFEINGLDGALLVAAAAGGWYAGLVGGALLAGGSEVAAGLYMNVGMFVGVSVFTTATGAVIKAVHFLNPTRRWKEANTLAASKIRQLKVGDVVLDMPISEYAARLTAALESN